MTLELFALRSGLEEQYLKLHSFAGSAPVCGPFAGSLLGAQPQDGFRDVGPLWARFAMLQKRGGY